MENRAKFGNYHLLFLALLLQQKKYSVLKRILYYTESQPPSYPLVPSTMSDCISVFENLNSKRDLELFSMEITDIDYNIKRINTIKIEGEYDEQIVAAYKNKVVENLKSGVQAYNVFMNTNSIDDAKKYNINSVASHFYPNEAFMKESNITIGTFLAIV